jgi:hypothetical protein
MPVKEGIEKYVASQFAGALGPIVASLVRVTAKGLLDWPLAATTKGEFNVWELPLLPVE